MGRDSNPRYAFDVNTLSRRDSWGSDAGKTSGFHRADVAIRAVPCSTENRPIPASIDTRTDTRDPGIMSAVASPEAGQTDSESEA